MHQQGAASIGSVTPQTVIERRRLLLGTLLFVAGMAILFMQPAFLALIGGRLSLNADNLGTLAAVETLGIGIASLTGPLWASRLDQRATVLLGAVVCAVGDVVTAYSHNFQAVLWSRFLVGFLGEGILLTVSYAVLHAARDVDRAFGIALTTVTAYGAAAIAVTGPLDRALPAVGPLLPAILSAVAVLAFIGWLPSLKQPRPPSVRRGIRPKLNVAAIVALAAQVVWFASPGAFWAFAEQVATDKGVSTDSAEIAVSIGEFVGLAGAVLAAGLGGRLGRMKPIAVATAGTILSAIAYNYCDGVTGLAVFLSLYYIFWDYGTVYQMSFISGLDSTGRAAVVMPAAQVIGQSIGPFCAGSFMVLHGDGAVTASTIGFALVGLALYLAAFAFLRRRNTALV
jgi:predicted MFS family arabinose efflux permease